MFCKNCGKQIEDNAKFCSVCGTAVTNIVVETSQQESGQKNSEQSENETVQKIKGSISQIIAASNAAKSAADEAAGDSSKVVIVDATMKYFSLASCLLFALGGVYCVFSLAIGTGFGSLLFAVALFFVKNAFAHGYIIDTANDTFSFAAVSYYKKAGFSPIEFVKTYLFGGSVHLTEIKKIEIENGVRWNSNKQEFSATKKLKVFGEFGHLNFYFGSHEKLTEVAIAISEACDLLETDK